VCGDSYDVDDWGGDDYEYYGGSCDGCGYNMAYDENGDDAMVIMIVIFVVTVTMTLVMVIGVVLVAGGGYVDVDMDGGDAG